MQLNIEQSGHIYIETCTNVLVGTRGGYMEGAKDELSSPPPP